MAPSLFCDVDKLPIKGISKIFVAGSRTRMSQGRGDFTTKRSSLKEYEALIPIRMPHGVRRSVLQKARGMQRLTAFAILIFGGKLQNFKEDLHSRSSSFCVLQI